MACMYELISLICVSFLLLSLHPKGTYYVKMTVFAVGSCIIVLLSIPFMIFRYKDYRNALLPGFGIRMFGRAIGVTMEVRGLENVKDHGNVILINHQSCLDLLVAAYIWPVIGRATVVAKNTVIYIPFFGIGAWMCGTLFINRSKRADSIQSLSKASKAIKDQNCKLLIFPEGTRNLGDKLLPFKKGAFHIAVENQCPVQPVVVSHYNFLNVTEKIFTPGRAIIYILPEISTEGYTKENIDELITKTRDTMQMEFNKISKETKLLRFGREGGYS